MTSIHIGSFVNAKLVQEDRPAQGVYVRDCGDGTIDILTMLDGMLKAHLDGVVVVPDENLDSDMLT